MTDHYEALHEKSKREEAKARRLHAMAQAHPVDLIGMIPPWAILAALAMFISVLAAMVIFNPGTGPEKRAAYYEAKLECRQSGGSFEYFGTQGYHCIGGKE